MTAHAKRAILTGASSGLGKALAKELLNHGYAVALVGRQQKALEDAVGPHKDRGKVVVCDLSNASEVDDLAARCKTALGGHEPIDLLVNCAGFSVTGKIDD